MSAERSLTQILQVDENKLPAKTRPAVKYLSLRWIEKGSPSESGALAVWLDDGLKFCVEQQFVYPKIFLKRLKQLQRGEWKPEATILL